MFVQKEIHRKYGDLLQLDTVNKSCLKIIEMNPCKNKPEVVRATLELSEELLLMIERRLGNRLHIGFLGCTVYPFKQHDRCSKCQSHDHKRRDCKRETPLCANCGGEHFTNQCKSTVIACCNCMQHVLHKESAQGHKASSSECPVFKEFQRNNARKNGDRPSVQS